MTIFEAVCLKQPRVAIDIIVIFRLDEMAESIGLELVEDGKTGIVKLMQHSTYHRVGRRVRQIQPGRVIA